MGVPSPDPELASLDECLEREKLPSEAVTIVAESHTSEDDTKKEWNHFLYV